MTDPGWQRTLDDFEATLRAQEASLDQGMTKAVPPFEPPVGLNPMPADFVHRATDLVARCRALEEKLAGALDDAHAQLDRLGETSAVAAAPAQPVFFDSRV